MAKSTIEYIARVDAKPIDITTDAGLPTANDSEPDNGNQHESSSDGGIPLVDPITGERIGDAVGNGIDSDSGPGDGNGNLGEFDSGEPTRKRRGRPKGFKLGPRTPKTETRSASLAGIERLLLTIHGMAAGVLDIKELSLEPEEAKELTIAINDVAKLYPVGMSEKTLAWANLGIVAMGVYGTRMAAYGIRKKMEKQRKIPSGPQSVPTQTKQQANGVPVPPTTRTSTGPQMVEPVTEYFQTPPRD